MNNHRGTVLFVDDEESILSALRRSLRKEGYRMFFCVTPDEALKVLETEQVDVLFTDYLMPEMTGVEFIMIVKELYPDMLRCVLTGQADLEVAVNAINKGHVHRFLLKPWNDLELKVTLKQLFVQLGMERANKSLTQMVEQQKARIAHLERKYPGISNVERDEDGAIQLDATAFAL